MSGLFSDIDKRKQDAKEIERLNKEAYARFGEIMRECIPAEGVKDLKDFVNLYGSEITRLYQDAKSIDFSEKRGTFISKNEFHQFEKWKQPNQNNQQTNYNN